MVTRSPPRKTRDAASHQVHLAHQFVAKDPGQFHVRALSLVDMKIGSADSRRFYPDENLSFRGEWHPVLENLYPPREQQTALLTEFTSTLLRVT